MAFHDSPRAVSLKTRLPARYSAPFSCGLAMSGEFQWKRNAGLSLLRLGPQHLDGPAPQVHAVDGSLLRLGVDDVRIGRVEGAVEPVAAADVDPVGVVMPSFVRVALGPTQFRLSCRPPQMRYGRAVVDGDAVELADGHRVHVRPCRRRRS